MQQQIVEMTQLIHKLEQRIIDLEQENKELKKKITELENKLRQYENPHTPSSRQRFKGNTGGHNASSEKHGGVIGHRGATRQVPKPDEIIPVTIDQCPHCGFFLGEPVSVEQRTIEEIPPPQKILVTRFDLHKYVCPGCGCEITAQHDDCPMVGGLGIHLMTKITLLRFQLRGVLRRIQEFLWCHWSFGLSATGVNDCSTQSWKCVSIEI